MSYASPELQRRIEEVIKVSRGAVESVIVAKQDGTPIVYVNTLRVQPEYLAAAISAISGVLSSILEVMEMGEFKRINVELSDKRHLFIAPLGDEIVALITRPNPNLGFIDLLLDLYFKEGERLG